MEIATIDPTTGSKVRTFAAHTDAEIETRLEHARTAFERTRRMPVAERAALVKRVGEALEADKAALARLMTLEMGKLYRGAIAEAEKCALGCRYYADNAEHFLRDEVVESSAEGRAFISYQPLGALLAIMPWNYPFWQVIRAAAPAVAAGNVVLLKHASNVPQCALALEETFRKAGAPEGVFQTLLVGPDRVSKIIADPRVAAVTLTGSEKAGRQVAADAGHNIKKTVLELGGSDPFIVMPSADLGKAVATAVSARTVNAGQSCIAAKRFFVHEKIYAEFESRFVAAMSALRVGDPMAEDTQIGPLATAAIRDGLAKQVVQSVAKGARVLTGGKAPDRGGFFYPPTVLAGLPPDAPVACEETFGPVAALFRVGSIDEAIRLANDSPLGLGSSAWTSDPAETDRFARELEAGSVFINGMVASDPKLPFGGIKLSGYGRELGAVGMREFVNIKTVRVRN
jgi:succinate-semialdehyde dehydrogenase/glutarate-semialdehyde dehydrogenase